MVTFVEHKKKFSSFFEAAELIPKGWGLMSDVAPSDFELSKLKFVQLSTVCKLVDYDDVHKLAIRLNGSLGLVDAKRILAEADAIPESLRSCDILFPGTRLHDSVGHGYTPCLRFSTNSQWYLDFRSHGCRWILGFCVSGRDHIACLK